MTQSASTGAEPGHVHDFTGHSALNLHLLSEHSNGAALSLSPEEAKDQHHHEHFGPGGIRNHPYESRAFDAAKATIVIDECAEMMGEDRAAATQELLTVPDEPEFGWLHTLPVGLHTHDAQNQTACTNGNLCPTYPRWVASHSERNPEPRVPATGILKFENASDMAAYHLMIMGRELVLLEATLTDPEAPKPFEAALAIAGRQHYTAVQAILFPILYPEAAADIGSDDSEDTPR